MVEKSSEYGEGLSVRREDQASTRPLLTCVEQIGIWCQVLVSGDDGGKSIDSRSPAALEAFRRALRRRGGVH